MFLRGPLASRLPVAMLHLCGSSAPSTSTSMSFLSTSSHVQSQCHNHAIPTSVPQLARHFGASLVWFRGGNGRELRKVEGARTENTNSNKNKGGEDPVEKRVKLIILLNAIYFLIITPLGFVVKWVRKDTCENRIPATAKQVDSHTFLEKYLRSGEIEKITYVDYLKKAIGTLHSGAIIDGNPVEPEYVVAEFNSKTQFVMEKRNVESTLGISPSQAVPIKMYSPWANTAGILDCVDHAIMVYLICISFMPHGREASRRIMAKVLTTAKNMLK